MEVAEDASLFPRRDAGILARAAARGEAKGARDTPYLSALAVGLLFLPVHRPRERE